ncbi:MAG: YkgJ family cysteine cluster protein [Euryarchaeota archaeon]|nr:YkgJ family cysteine cluster protein [Euryarchaeota archaeon]
MSIPNSRLAEAKRLCHERRSAVCVDQKRRGLHLEFLKDRPHWSVLRRQEQYATIDRGEKVPFDIAVPLPAKDPRTPKETSGGVELFWETFECAHCGRCCYTPGAGLYLEKEDMERICEHLGLSMKKLKKLCHYDKSLKIWALKQPCPFYDREAKKCTIYPVRPLTCTRYPLHPPLKEMPYHLAVDAFCPAARELVKETLGWWIICENNWRDILEMMGR